MQLDDPQGTPKLPQLVSQMDSYRLQRPAELLGMARTSEWSLTLCPCPQICYVVPARASLALIEPEISAGKCQLALDGLRGFGITPGTFLSHSSMKL